MGTLVSGRSGCWIIDVCERFPVEMLDCNHWWFCAMEYARFVMPNVWHIYFELLYFMVIVARIYNYCIVYSVGYRGMW